MFPETQDIVTTPLMSLTDDSTLKPDFVPLFDTSQHIADQCSYDLFIPALIV